MFKRSPLCRPAFRLGFILPLLAVVLAPAVLSLAEGEHAPPPVSSELITPAFVPATADEPEPVPDASEDELRPRRIENSYCHTAMGVTACYWSEGSICWATGCYVGL